MNALPPAAGRPFDFVVTLPKGFDSRSRICVVEGKIGEHAMLIVTHPTQKTIVVDMQTKTWRQVAL